MLTYHIVGAYNIIANPWTFGISERSAVVGEVHCVGTEPELLECSHSSFGYHFCGLYGFFFSPDIAISCYGMRLPTYRLLKQNV